LHSPDARCERLCVFRIHAEQQLSCSSLLLNPESYLTSHEANTRIICGDCRASRIDWIRLQSSNAGSQALGVFGTCRKATHVSPSPRAVSQPGGSSRLARYERTQHDVHPSDGEIALRLGGDAHHLPCTPAPPPARCTVSAPHSPRRGRSTREECRPTNADARSSRPHLARDARIHRREASCPTIIHGEASARGVTEFEGERPCTCGPAADAQLCVRLVTDAATHKTKVGTVTLRWCCPLARRGHSVRWHPERATPMASKECTGGIHMQW
jgi:hypothetical protein